MTKLGRSTNAVASGAIVAGGLLMAALWLVFTPLHGPTSYNEGHLLWGRDMHFWGMLLGVVPNTLIAAGLIALRGRLATPSRLAAIGHGLTCVGLVVAAVLDLAVQAMNAPFFLPVQAVGVLMLAAGLKSLPAHRPLRIALMVLGGLLGTGMIVAFIPQGFSDSIGGYRIFGILAYFLPGLVWSLVGHLLSRSPAERP